MRPDPKPRNPAIFPEGGPVHARSFFQFDCAHNVTFGGYERQDKEAQLSSALTNKVEVLLSKTRRSALSLQQKAKPDPRPLRILWELWDNESALVQRLDVFVIQS
jgi:hypothetical protein